MNHWLLLAAAIAFEVVATSALKASDGFTRTLPSIMVVCGYGVSFYLLALVLRSLPVGVVYAIWSGVGTAAIALVGWLVYRQTLSITALLGIALIIAGVVVLNLGGGHSA